MVEQTLLFPALREPSVNCLELHVDPVVLEALYSDPSLWRDKDEIVSPLRCSCIWHSLPDIYLFDMGHPQLVVSGTWLWRTTHIIIENSYKTLFSNSVLNSLSCTNNLRKTTCTYISTNFTNHAIYYTHTHTHTHTLT